MRQLSALAQPTRFALFKTLIRAGEDGIAAGRLAEDLKVDPNTLSAHLTVLSRADLIRSRRDGRHIIYSCVMAEVGALIDALVNDCCAGHPEACAAVLGGQPSAAAASAC
ncbi:MAG: helix-turn-helix transcriptional regulator [Parvularcula sp.]|nr:helix-turn-helix transcriptional regulator [Parvularcula sp.]